jgi:hypothetical protein
MADIPEEVMRRMTTDSLRQGFEASIQQRVDRYLEVSHQPITPHHHFAEGSAECISLYTDGYFLSTVIVTQSVAEGIRNFVADRNGIERDQGMNGDQVVELLVKKGIISSECAEAFTRIWKRWRNDLHHMLPTVAGIPAQIPFSELAKMNIQDLATIEKEIFAVELRSGTVIPVQPQYWDTNPDGTGPVFLRCSP